MYLKALGAEVLVGLDAVAGDAQHHRAGGHEGVVEVAEVLALGGAAGRAVLGVEVQHDLLALQGGEGEAGVAGGGQGEVGRGLVEHDVSVGLGSCPRSLTSCRPTGNRVRARHGAESPRSGRVEDEGGGYVAVLGDQDVIGAAGGAEVHHLEADAGLDQRPHQLGLREALAHPGAEDQDLAAQAREVGEGGLVEGVEAARMPAGVDALGHHDQRALVAGVADLHVVGVVAGDGVVLLALVEVEFHRDDSLGLAGAGARPG